MCLVSRQFGLVCVVVWFCIVLIVVGCVWFWWLIGLGGLFNIGFALRLLLYCGVCCIAALVVGFCCR